MDNTFAWYKLFSYRFIKSDALYLVWVDISQYTTDDIYFRDYVAKNTGVYFSDGSEYGKNGKGFIRVNLATQRERVIEAAKRLKECLNNFKK